MTNNNNSNNPTIIVTVGIDIGADSTKVVLGPRFSCEIVRNDVGGHTTPSAISFANDNGSCYRNIGAAAAQSKTSLKGISRLLAGETTSTSSSSLDDNRSALLFGSTFEIIHDDEQAGGGGVVIKGIPTTTSKSTTTTTTSVTTLLAMLLRKIRTHVESTLKRIMNNEKDTSSLLSYELEYDLLLASESQKDENDNEASKKNQLLDAAYAAGLNRARIIPSSKAYQVCYSRKFPEEKKKKKTILVIDMGKSQTTVVVMGTKEEDDNNNNNNVSNKEEEGKDEKEPTTTASSSSSLSVLSSVRSKTLGAGSVDLRLYQYFLEKEEEKLLSKKTNISNKNRHRLLEGCSKLKILLSQLPEATVTVENINDLDLKLSMTQSTLNELCQTDADELTQLIQRAVCTTNGTSTSASTSSIDSIEVTGGGCRIPWVKETILSTVNNMNSSSSSNTTTTTLSYSLDDTSAALGAAVWGEEQQEQEEDLSSSSCILNETDDRKELRLIEEELYQLDEDYQAKATILNKMEAHILELRSAKHDNDDKYGHLLPGDELDQYLMDIEDWLFSDEALTATMDQVETKWQQVNDHTTNTLAKDYLQAKQDEQAAKDAEMEAEAKLAQAAAAASSSSGEDDNPKDDYDNRRLPKKRRMEIVIKNKAEANELFGDGNYKFAAARYTKALTHCTKFVDLNPTDIEEVNALKVSLNCNLALAYLKLQNYGSALRVCHDALEIDPQSTKALYRRACVYYEQKQWDKAFQDVKIASGIVPTNNDKAIAKLQQKIEVQIQRQKIKEKKMAKKMFG